MTDRRYFGPSYRPKHWDRTHYNAGPAAAFGGALATSSKPAPVPLVEAKIPIAGTAPVQAKLVLNIRSVESTSWDTQWVKLDRQRQGKFSAHSLVVFLENTEHENLYRVSLYTIDLEGKWNYVHRCNSRHWAKFLGPRALPALAAAQARQREWIRQNAPESTDYEGEP